MKGTALALLVALVALSAAPVLASGPVSVYAIVEKVTMEPNESTPQTIQIWGAFSTKKPGNDATYNPAERGYLYYKIDSTLCQSSSPRTCTADMEKATRALWTDLKKKAGTGEAVGFGGAHPFIMTLKPIKIRKTGEKAESPDPFPLGNPLILLGSSQADVVAKLKAALLSK